MFNLQHILYMVISALVTAVLMILATKKVQNNKTKDLILKLSAVSTVIIHYSCLLVDFFQNDGDALISSTHILPVYPCNIVMWMLLILAYTENKKSLAFKLFADFCFIIGTICGIVGILLNENFGSNPTLADYDILKGMVSHSTMLFGCIYLYFGKYVKPGIESTFGLFAGFGVFVLCGLGVNILYTACGMEAPDGIWINGVPYVGLSSIILGFLAILIYFGVFALIELRLPTEKRWYARLKAYFKK